MTEPTYQQTPYPLILALSVALFLHVVLATLVSGWLSLPDPDRPEPTVRVRIAVAGAQTNARTVATTPETTDADPGPPPEPRKEPAETSASPADASTPGDAKRKSEAARALPESRSSPNPREEAATQPSSPPAKPEIARASGTDSPVTDADTDTPVTRLSRDETRERSGYELALWEKIARQIEYTPLIRELDAPRNVVLELSLMANGALRRARVETSSGIDGLDQIAREAALAATPFPEPPEGRRRFSVRLIFEPDTR